MKQAVIIRVLIMCILVFSVHRSSAQIPILEIIRAGVKKAIKAIDLKVQRLQNKTIWLQNAQKALENQMQALKLGEITDWVEKQRKLYQDYYEELWKVKAALAYYHKVRDIIERQVQLVAEYKRAMALCRSDKRFTPEEIRTMEKVYSGILAQSTRNLDQLDLVIHSFTTRMSDAARLELIHAAGRRLEQQLTDLRQFTSQNMRLSLQRAKDRSEIEQVKAWYGLN